MEKTSKAIEGSEGNRPRTQSSGSSTSYPPSKKPRAVEEGQDPPTCTDDDDECSPGQEEPTELNQIQMFRMWLLKQKMLGTPATSILQQLGLRCASRPETYSAQEFEAQLWDTLISLGPQLLQPPTPPRRKLQKYNTFQDALQLLQQSSKVLLLTGAGISVSCGIPDFRSENGIYSRLQEYNLPNPQCMFDIEFFRENPNPFYAFAKELLPKADGFSYVPSKSHYFIRLLEEKGKLLRCYSQNIDMLEDAAGISKERVVQCHGSFANATCTACGIQVPGNDLRPDIAEQKVPKCKECDGVMKPDIIFFGEALPKRFHDLIAQDQDEADVVIVMGSSLKVNPVRGIVSRIPSHVPMILINREVVGEPHEFDIELLGYCDKIVQELCVSLGWEIPTPSEEIIRNATQRLQLEQTEEAEEKGEGGISNLSTVTDEAVDLPYEFDAPCRHYFEGSIKEATSVSDDELQERPSDDASSGEHQIPEVVKEADE